MYNKSTAQATFIVIWPCQYPANNTLILQRGGIFMDKFAVGTKNQNAGEFA